MSFSFTGAFASSFRRLFQRATGKSSTRMRRSHRGSRRRLLFESLENRAVMATLGDISGRLFVATDTSGFKPGEQVVGATVNLYTDNGDGVFNAGTDTLSATTTTDANGIYDFPGLGAGNYFIEQIAQTVGGKTVAHQVSPLTTVTANDALNGHAGATIDTFATTGPNALTNSTAGNTASATKLGLTTAETIGGVRQLTATLNASGGTVNDFAQTSVTANQLFFTANTTSDSGSWNAIWDATGTTGSINQNGLGGQDLTAGGTLNSIHVNIGSQSNPTPAQVQFIIFSGTGNSSQSTLFTLAQPVAGNPTSDIVIPFSNFTTTSGTGGNFANVGAIEMKITSPSLAVQGTAKLVNILGPTETANFQTIGYVNLTPTKVIDNGSPLVGTNVTYTVTVANAAGVADATNLVITDQLPAGLTFVSSNPSSGAYNSTTGVWTVGTLASGASATLQIVATVTVSGTKTNTATITSLDQNNIGAPPSASVPETPTFVDLAVTKIVNNATPNKNQNVTFTIGVTNQGTANATGVALNDTFPAGLTFVSSNPSTGSYNSTTGVWTIGNLNAAAAATLTIVATASTAGLQTNSVTATSTQTDSNPANNTASVGVTPNSADIGIAKVVNNPTPNNGQNVTFTITATDNGPTNATNITVNDPLPAGITFVSATPSVGTYNSTTGVWTIPAINNGANATLAIVGTVTTSGAKTNTATLGTLDQFDTNANNNTASATVTPNIADIGITKTVNNATPNQNQNVTFTITATDNGPINATNITVNDPLPAGITFVSSTPSVGTYNSTTGVWTIPAINNGANATLQIVGTATTSGAKTNTATLGTLDQFDTNAANNSASATVTPNVADIAITKTVDNATPNKNANVTFTITASDVGPANATNITVNDVLPAGITFVSSTPSVGTYNSTTGVWTIPAINAAANATLQIVGTVTTAGAKTNTATLGTLDQFDTNAANNSGTATVTPNVADLSVTKTVSNEAPTTNQNVTYTVIVSNNGPAAATNVTLNDPLPTGVTFVSSNPTVGTYNSTTGVWTIPTLNNGVTATLSIVGTVTIVGTITNSATVVPGDQFDPSLANNTATAPLVAVPPSSDLGVTKTVNNATPDLNQNVTFIVTLTNTGPTIATNVVLTDLLPAGLTFVSSTPSQGTYVAGTGVWTVGTVGLTTGVNAVASPTLTIVATVTTRGVKTNTASITAVDQPDPNAANNTANAVVTPNRVSKRSYLAE